MSSTSIESDSRHLHNEDLLSFGTNELLLCFHPDLQWNQHVEAAPENGNKKQFLYTTSLEKKNEETTMEEKVKQKN